MPCFGQFSEIWTNGELFAVDQMASQCYSASVERCVAVGVTPDTPSWWDYLLGKNRAKLLSVKNNIRNTYLAYIKPYPNMGTRLDTFFTDGLAFTNEIDLLTYCSLPTNSLDETPYFKSQYQSTTGGWFSCYTILTNLVWTKRVIEWSPWAITSELPVFDVWLRNPDYDIDPSFLDLLPKYTYSSNLAMYVWGVTGLRSDWSFAIWPYENNARGSWTTYPDSDTWATNMDVCWAGYTNSITLVTNLGGFNWNLAMKPYPVWQKPQEIGSFSRHRIGYSINTNTSGTNGIDSIWTNVWEEQELFGPYTDYLGFATNFYTYETNSIVITNYVVESTNYFMAPSNYLGTVATNLPMTSNATAYAEDAVVMFAGLFAGSRDVVAAVYHYVVHYFGATNVPHLYTTNVPAQSYNYTLIPTNVPQITTITNIIQWPGTNVFYEWEWVEHSGLETNYVFCPTSTVVTTNNGTLKYTCGAITIGAYPYILPYDRVKYYGNQEVVTYWGWPTNFTLPFERVIDYWITRESNTTVTLPPYSEQWNGYNIGAPFGYSNYVMYGESFGASTSTNEFTAFVWGAKYSYPDQPHLRFSTYPPWTSITSSLATVSGKYISGTQSGYGETHLDFFNVAYMCDYSSISNVAYNVHWAKDVVMTYPQLPNFTVAHGFQVGRCLAIERWNATTNGFKYR